MHLEPSDHAERCAHCTRMGFPQGDNGLIRLNTIWYETTTDTFICERCVLLEEDPDQLALELDRIAEAYRDHAPHDEGFHD